MFFPKDYQLSLKKNLANTQTKEKKNLTTNSKSIRNQQFFLSYPPPTKLNIVLNVNRKKCKARKGMILAKHCFPVFITKTKQYRSISVIGKEETKCENYHHKNKTKEVKEKSEDTPYPQP